MSCEWSWHRRSSIPSKQTVTLSVNKIPTYSRLWFFNTLWSTNGALPAAYYYYYCFFNSFLLLLLLLLLNEITIIIKQAIQPMRSKRYYWLQAYFSNWFVFLRQTFQPTTNKGFINWSKKMYKSYDSSISENLFNIAVKERYDDCLSISRYLFAGSICEQYFMRTVSADTFHLEMSINTDLLHQERKTRSSWLHIKAEMFLVVTHQCRHLWPLTQSLRDE